MNGNNDIIIDEKSGISAEEQQEILSQINGIAEKNKRHFAENASVKTEKITPKKKGFIFPLAVNAAAVAFLCIGAFLLISFNSKADVQARTGNAVYNVTERALISEIRKDTAGQIAAKEAEIAAIASRMEEIDKELALIYSGDILTPEQIDARERLIAAQNAFRDELYVLNSERSQILESSRSREAMLRAQLEERTRELADTRQLVSSDLETAVNELAKLSGEQERIAAIDAHFAGGLASISDFIQKNQYAQAAQSAANLRDFLNSNMVSQSNAFRVKKEYYNQSLNLLEVLIADAIRNSAEGQLELIAQNKELQETVDSMRRTIDASASGSSGQVQRIKEMEEAAAALRSQVTTLRATGEQNIAEKDKTISSLQTDKASLAAANDELRSNVTSLTARAESQAQQIAALNNALSAIQQLSAFQQSSVIQQQQPPQENQ